MLCAMINIAFLASVLVNVVIGNTEVRLNNHDSRKEETNIGSLITDSMIDWVNLDSPGII